MATLTESITFMKDSFQDRKILSHFISILEWYLKIIHSLNQNLPYQTTLERNYPTLKLDKSSVIQHPSKGRKQH